MLSEIISFVSVWNHRAKDDAIVGASHSGVLSKDVVKVITLRTMLHGLNSLDRLLPDCHKMYRKHERDIKSAEMLLQKHELTIRKRIEDIQSVLRLPGTRVLLVSDKNQDKTT